MDIMNQETGRDRKKFLLLGQTGSGKSALCNAMSQPLRSESYSTTKNYSLFPETSHQKIGNTDTVVLSVNFLGKKKRLTLIDTIGFNTTNINDTAITDLIVGLKEQCDKIHLFGIVVDSPKRIDSSLKETLELFESMFGKESFWENACVIMTNLPQSQEMIDRRSKGCSDDQIKAEFNTVLKKMFELTEDVPTLIIDAHYDGSDKFEKSQFRNAMKEISGLLQRSEGTNLQNVNEVFGKYEGLQDDILRLGEELNIEKERFEEQRKELKIEIEKASKLEEELEAEKKSRDKCEKIGVAVSVVVVVVVAGTVVVLFGPSILLALKLAIVWVLKLGWCFLPVVVEVLKEVFG